MQPGAGLLTLHYLPPWLKYCVAMLIENVFQGSWLLEDDSGRFTSI